MPIYGNYGVNNAPWVKINEMATSELAKLMMIFKKAEKKYSFDDVFLKSIIYNDKMKQVYIATYDISKTNMNEFTYRTQLEGLIKYANEMIIKKKNIKFDIMGTWVTGKIIIMTKNKTEQS